MLAPSPPLKPPVNHIGLALMLALILHVLFILGVSFDIDDAPDFIPEQGLDITIVHTRANLETPEDATMLAQVSQQGGAETLDEPRFTAPQSEPSMVPDENPAKALERAGSDTPQATIEKEIVSSVNGTWETPSNITEVPIKAPVKPDISQLLASTQQEIVRLTAELDQQARNSSNKTRRKAINASTQEFIYATYMDAWRKKVERIGNLNYPDEAKSRKLRGNLMLHVALRKDGTVEGIRIVRSSGHKVLDDAAIRIVKLAAPYPAFPPEIRKQVDVLDITRTWQFLDGNRLFSTE